MTKAFELDWKVPVPAALEAGATLDRWTEEKDHNPDLELDCLFRVDDCGFFLFWKSEGREGDVLELSQVFLLVQITVLPENINISIKPFYFSEFIFRAFV